MTSHQPSALASGQPGQGAPPDATTKAAPALTARTAAIQAVWPRHLITPDQIAEPERIAREWKPTPAL